MKNLPRDPDSDRHLELEAFRDRMAGLPIRDPREALLDCFGRALESLARPDLAKLRHRVVEHFGTAHAFVEIIDGHVALRDIRENL